MVFLWKNVYYVAAPILVKLYILTDLVTLSRFPRFIFIEGFPGLNILEIDSQNGASNNAKIYFFHYLSFSFVFVRVKKRT